MAWARNDGAVAPGAVVLRSTLTLFEMLPALTTVRSGRPSPFISPIATARETLPVVNVVAVAYDGVVTPVAVVFRSTPTVPLVPKLL